MSDPKEIMTCKCGLVQYRGQQTACRRCHTTFLKPEPIALPVEVVQPRGKKPPAGTLAERVKAVRVEAGLSQRQVASAMGCPRSYISKIENGKTNPTLAQIDRLAHALCCPISALFPPPLPIQLEPVNDPGLVDMMRELVTFAGKLSLAQWQEVNDRARKMRDKSLDRAKVVTANIA